MEYPEFGVELSELSDAEMGVLEESCNLRSKENITRFVLFRRERSQLSVYLPDSTDDWIECEVEDAKALEAVLPKPFRINAEVPLPSSVPIRYLATGDESTLRYDRSARIGLLDVIDHNREWFSSQEQVAAQAANIHSHFQQNFGRVSPNVEEMRLADDLLVKVAGIDRSAFEELLRAAKTGDEGYANGIIEMMNRELATSLNFPRWWSQDHEFELRVSLRDSDLVLTVKDRTRTEYSFKERSGGLRYFLSYFVQYLAHEFQSDGTAEVLLMDEPDAYLSSSGQQDLLKIFEAFAYPTESDRPKCQVVYVTHSPFLIDKNHAERIRVLEKGEDDEGARIVGNIGRNHYEPLRTAFGGFVGETTFISNCNLMLEGPSDQVLLAGVSSFIRRRNASNENVLDLNSITLVPAGSAMQVPYTVYLARGRDEDKPAVIVLLDSDEEGGKARKELASKAGSGRKRLADDLVIQIGDLKESSSVQFTRPDGSGPAIEDLIPLEVLTQATIEYVDEFLGARSKKKLENGQMLGTASDAQLVGQLEDWARAQLGSGFHLEKVGLARSVLKVLNSGSVSEDSINTLIANFGALFEKLRRMQRSSLRRNTEERVSQRIRRSRRAFSRDHVDNATAEDCEIFLTDVERVVSSSLDSEDLTAEVRKVRRTYLDEFKSEEEIGDLDGFLGAIDSLALLERRNAQGDDDVV